MARLFGGRSRQDAQGQNYIVHRRAIFRKRRRAAPTDRIGPQGRRYHYPSKFSQLEAGLGKAQDIIGREIV